MSRDFRILANRRMEKEPVVSIIRALVLGVEVVEREERRIVASRWREIWELLEECTLCSPWKSGLGS